MHISKIDLNLFTVFDAIYSEGSVSAAARKLNLTQPAVSHSLKRLRQLMGDPLFERHGQRMMSTSVARGLIEPIRRALRGLEVTLNQLDDFAPATSTRQFTLAMRDVFESGVLPSLMNRLASCAPEVEVTATRVARTELVAELAAGAIDAAIDILLPLPPDVKHVRLVHENTVVLARPGHPALQDGKGLTLGRYLAQDHVLVTSRRSGPGIEDFELSRLGLTRKIRLRCQHFFAACKVVSQTDMLLTMPDRYARIVNQQFGNQVLTVPFAMPAWEVYLYWHASVDNDPANSWLRDNIIRTFQL